MNNVKVSALLFSMVLLFSCQKENYDLNEIQSSPVYASTALGEPNLEGDQGAGGCKFGDQYCVTYCCVTIGNQVFDDLLESIDNNTETEFLTQAKIDSLNLQDSVISGYWEAVMVDSADVTYLHSSDSLRVAFYFDSTSADTASYSAAWVVDLE